MPVEGWDSMVAVLVIAAVVLCCGLCAYGIGRAVQRARERRGHDSELVTGR